MRWGSCECIWIITRPMFQQGRRAIWFSLFIETCIDLRKSRIVLGRHYQSPRLVTPEPTNRSSTGLSTSHPRAAIRTHKPPSHYSPTLPIREPPPQQATSSPSQNTSTPDLCLKKLASPPADTRTHPPTLPFQNLTSPVPRSRSFRDFQNPQLLRNDRLLSPGGHPSTWSNLLQPASEVQYLNPPLWKLLSHTLSANSACRRPLQSPYNIPCASTKWCTRSSASLEERKDGKVPTKTHSRSGKSLRHSSHSIKRTRRRS